MRIAATCDIHYDLISSLNHRQKLQTFVQELAAERPDVLVVAGDLVGLGWDKLGECLELFRHIAPHRLMVFGNHDHWSFAGDSIQHLKKLQEIIYQSGFLLLDAKPEIINGVGFAGNSLWYDYSLSTLMLPPGSSYDSKVFNGHIIWNDAHFVKLGKSDEDYVAELLVILEQDIHHLEKKTDRIVAVTHHIGFDGMLRKKKNDPAWNFSNAFMGTRKLGNLLLAHPKVRYHVCGHTHCCRQMQINGLQVINPGSDYIQKRYLVFEIS